MGLSVPNLATGGDTQTTMQDHHTERIAQKEKSHVVDYRCNSINPVAARIFRSEHKPKLPANRQLDPCSDRHRSDPRYLETVGNRLVLDPRFVENRRGGQAGCLSLHIARNVFNPP